MNPDHIRLSLTHPFDLSTRDQRDFDATLQDFDRVERSYSMDMDSQRTNVQRTLGTMPGVFCPIALSMFSILIFMRMGFVLAHAGVLQVLLQFGLCFLILFCTALSVCALATNGAIVNGGVYHMISRALGPEFGGAIGMLFFIANVIGNGQSVAALVEALVEIFGAGSRSNPCARFHSTSSRPKVR